jgi:hypothetical protein
MVGGMAEVVDGRVRCDLVQVLHDELVLGRNAHHALPPVALVKRSNMFLWRESVVNGLAAHDLGHSVEKHPVLSIDLHPTLLPLLLSFGIVEPNNARRTVVDVWLHVADSVSMSFARLALDAPRKEAVRGVHAGDTAAGRENWSAFWDTRLREPLKAPQLVAIKNRKIPKSYTHP